MSKLTCDKFPAIKMWVALVNKENYFFREVTKRDFQTGLIYFM